jgi:hypothetical protein
MRGGRGWSFSAEMKGPSGGPGASSRRSQNYLFFFFAAFFFFFFAAMKITSHQFSIPASLSFI